MARISAADAGGVNVLAFLDMIAYSEIGVYLLAASDDGYNILVGATAKEPRLFYDYSHHPRILNRDLDSTAAGRYQIIWPTWSWLLSSHGYMDFGPKNQDFAAIDLIKNRNAYDAVANGDVEVGIHLCREEWASLPGAGYGQHEQKIANLVSFYNGALGKYAI
jgi:muramidase (phage lysozyme)